MTPKADPVLVVDELQNFCRERLARYKVPRRIQLISALPVTSVGKVDKARLRSLATPEQTG